MAVWFDRYGLWVLVPGEWLLSWAFVAVREAILRSRIARGIAVWDFFGLLVCWGLLAHFGTSYFAIFYRSGGEAHISSRTCLTGEPKFAVGVDLRKLLEKSELEERPLILSGDWFAYWPVVYALQGWERSKGEFLRIPNKLDGTPILPEDFTKVVSTRKVIVVDFVGGRPWETWEKVFYYEQNLEEQRCYSDQAGRPVLRVGIYRMGRLAF
ncbi:MAG: hypothetical protein N2035_09435 [Chthoniobacterales bacterium]|nr:hypothetical protein [Chthoniobacterales bacterium]